MTWQRPTWTMLIYCAQCGKQIPYASAWYEQDSRTKVCSNACLKAVQKAYAALVPRREGPRKAS